MNQAIGQSEAEANIIEKQMLQDKMSATDWEATSEAIEQQIAQESYLEWLKQNEKETVSLVVLKVRNKLRSYSKYSLMSQSTFPLRDELEMALLVHPRQAFPPTQIFRALHILRPPVIVMHI